MAPAQRLRRLVVEQHGLVWRTLRRLGVPDDEVEDAAQRVFIVAARRLESIKPEQERSFVFGSALRIASEVRRSRRRREQLVAEPSMQADPAPGPEDALLRGEFVRALGELLDKLPAHQRAVLLLHDLEEMTMADVASTLCTTRGTVASRLHRARHAFRQLVVELYERYEQEEP